LLESRERFADLIGLYLIERELQTRTECFGFLNTVSIAFDLGKLYPNRTSSMASFPKRCFGEFVDWAESAFKLSSESIDSKSIKLDIRTLS